MDLSFVNRVRELKELGSFARRGGLFVVFGRRRVGKTRLLRHWLAARGGMYSQAIEAPREIQVQQVFEDLRPQLETEIAPKSWKELFEILSLQKKRWALCLDEFPYLAVSDASLPSQLQRWLDHDFPRGCSLILAGSSIRMMNDLFLNRSAPLFGRATKLMQVPLMDFAAFCDALGLRRDAASFERFACVGGVPKYWEFVEPRRDAVALAEALYFDFAPYMEQEPHRLLRDEGATGLGALAVLEAIGRGAERPSEIASRLATAQTNLSRLLQQLLDASILQRELPYGESVRTTKKTLYRIQDPALRFWFRVFSPHRSRWSSYDAEQRRKLVHDHAASVFEDHCRALFPGSARHWDANVELDLVAPDPDDRKGGLVVAEIKWRALTKAQRVHTLKQLEAKWERCSLRAKHARVRFAVLDASVVCG